MLQARIRYCAGGIVDGIPTILERRHFQLWDFRSIPSNPSKYNDKDHAGLADGTAAPEEHLPRYFAKHGHPGEDPKKTKKNGGGKGNWGNPGDEVLDDQFNFVNARRRSNSSGYANNLQDFKTKFEFNEPEPVFEESIHGPEIEEELTKTDSVSTSGSSVDESAVKNV